MACANFHCSVPGVLSPLIRRALFFYSGQRGALCQLLLPADTKISSSVYYKQKLCAMRAYGYKKTQLCIQQLKSGLHCKYSVVTHMWRSYVRRIWGGLISMVAPPMLAALALALAGVSQRGPTPTTRTAGLSHVAVCT